jgi:protein O-GlcNAc transferase
MADPAEILRQADALHLNKRFAEAAALYRQALSLNDASADGWYGLGHCLLSVRSYGDAADPLQQALTLQPDNAGARCNLAEALFQLGRVDEAVQHYRQAASSGHPEATSVSLDALACIAPGSTILDNEAVLALRRDWAERTGRDISPLTPAPRERGRKLRIGYVSAFFGDRNWMKPVFGVINQHDRDRFEIHMLSDGGDPTEGSGYVDHPEDRIWQTNALSNEQLARHIVAAGLDLLVDLNGYSAQRRLPLFMHRPARRQIGWFNMFATTGMTVFDCLVADAAVLPPDEDAFYCERIHRVPGSYLAFAVRYPVPDVAQPPSLANGYITFGCLGSAYKLTDTVIEAWSRIMADAPNTRLLLKNGTLDDASNRAALLGRFANHGIAAERLLLEGRDEHYEFLRAYGRIDVALDTFPYNGGTTTTEALWQGVPVLTFNGDRWAGRTSRSLLLAAGLADWVMHDQAGYIEAAIRLARTPQTLNDLAALRAAMRERLLQSQACDCATLCRALEALYVAEAG